jgi:hypothetical protein
VNINNVFISSPPVSGEILNDPDVGGWLTVILIDDDDSLPGIDREQRRENVYVIPACKASLGSSK